MHCISQNNQGYGMVASKYQNFRDLTQLKAMQVKVLSFISLLHHLEYVAQEVMAMEKRKMQETYQLLSADKEVMHTNSALIYLFRINYMFWS